MEVEMGCSKSKTQNLPHNSRFSIKQILITQNDLAGILNHEKFLIQKHVYMIMKSLVNISAGLGQPEPESPTRPKHFLASPKVPEPELFQTTQPEARPSPKFKPEGTRQAFYTEKLQ